MTRFVYVDFKQKIWKPYSLDAILPKILCRIQIWASKIGLPTGKMTSIKIQFFKNLHRCRCNQKLNNYHSSNLLYYANFI